MRAHTTIFLAALAAPAAAQPVTQPSRCEVTIAKAPDEVREAIEAWVAAEPRCAITLEVRAVPTEGGFYLFARDAAGRVRERIVPDAQTAGVLVASWVADDLIDRLPPPSTTPPPVDTPVEIPAEPMPPGATAPVTAPITVGPPTTLAAKTEPPRARGNWLTLGGMVQMHGEGAGGARAELDVLRRGKWTLGAVFASSWAHHDLDNWDGDYVKTTDLRLLVTLARTKQLGRRWEMRVGVGAGVLGTSAKGFSDGDPIEARGVFPTAEASVLFSRSIYNNWSVGFGPIVSLYAQEWIDLDPHMTIMDRNGDVMFLAGVRRKLF
jgi:hypothetical protein